MVDFCKSSHIYCTVKTLAVKKLWQIWRITASILPRFFTNFYKFHNLGKWTSIRQSFFCQISYSPYSPNLFTTKVFNCTVANLKRFEWFYCITKITMIVKYLIVVVRPIWQHKFGNNRKLYINESRIMPE